MKSKIESAQETSEISEENGADIPNEDALKLSNPLVEDRPKLVSSEGSTFIYVGPTACSAFASRIRPPNQNHRSTLHRQHYSHVSFSRRSTTNFTLPNEGKANLLVESMFSFIGADYYFFLKRTFRETLRAIYRDPSNAHPVSLVCMFTVFALGELYSPATATGGGTPGISFFDQAMSQHVDLYEDPTISYIESLLLIVWPPFRSLI